nr:hypothetical protein Itr_chr12CG13690 [Ipomoea trifida]
MTGDLGSAQRAGRVVLNPRIDAVDVETMAALRQLPAPLAAGDVVQTHGAVRPFFSIGVVVGAEDERRWVVLVVAAVITVEPQENQRGGGAGGGGYQLELEFHSFRLEKDRYWGFIKLVKLRK